MLLVVVGYLLYAVGDHEFVTLELCLLQLAVLVQLPDPVVPAMYVNT